LKVTIGGREQIANTSLLIGRSEDAWIEFKADTWNVRLHVLFIENADEKDQGFQLLGKNDHAELTFKNWKSSLPAAIETPFTLGEVNGKTVVFLFTGYTVGGFRRIDFSFFWGVSNGS
jgi:hypothetical protein